MRRESWAASIEVSAHALDGVAQLFSDIVGVAACLLCIHGALNLNYFIGISYAMRRDHLGGRLQTQSAIVKGTSFPSATYRVFGPRNGQRSDNARRARLGWRSGVTTAVKMELVPMAIDVTTNFRIANGLDFDSRSQYENNILLFAGVSCSMLYLEAVIRRYNSGAMRCPGQHRSTRVALAITMMMTINSRDAHVGKQLMKSP